MNDCLLSPQGERGPLGPPGLPGFTGNPVSMKLFNSEFVSLVVIFLFSFPFLSFPLFFALVILMMF